MTIVILSIIKNIIIIPGIILLAIISIEYIKDTLKKYKKGEKRYMIFLAQRYTINGLIISGITVFVQSILNGVFIWVVKLFIN